jgi:hypothetical protein
MARAYGQSRCTRSTNRGAGQGGKESRGSCSFAFTNGVREHVCLRSFAFVCSLTPAPPPYSHTIIVHVRLCSFARRDQGCSKTPGGAYSSQPSRDPPRPGPEQGSPLGGLRGTARCHAACGVWSNQIITAPGAHGLQLLVPDRRAQHRALLPARAELRANNVLSCSPRGERGPGNPVLSDEPRGALGILRMNREFMTFMRTHYNHLTHDHFLRPALWSADREDATDE